MARFLNLIRNEEGATAIEYGLIAALIAVAAIGAMQSIGSRLNTTFNNVTNTLPRSYDARASLSRAAARCRAAAFHLASTRAGALTIIAAQERRCIVWGIDEVDFCNGCGVGDFPGIRARRTAADPVRCGRFEHRYQLPVAVKLHGQAALGDEARAWICRQ